VGAGRQVGSGKSGKDLQGNTRVGNLNQDLALGGKGTIDKDGRGRALIGSGEVTLVFRKSKVTGLGTIGRGEALQHQGGISGDFGAKERGDLRDSDAHDAMRPAG
jgi:hypothetical protein